MVRIGMHDAKTQLSKLVERAERGEEILITRHGEPAVRLVPARQSDGFRSLAGRWKGRVRIGPDFDELPAELTKPLGIDP